MSRPAVEVADLLHMQGDHFIDRNPWLSYQQLNVLRAIRRCRTSALGGHIDRCSQCGHQAISERNEHLSGTVTAAGRVNALRLRIRMGGIGWPKRFWYWTMIYKFADDCRHTAPLPTRRSRSCHGAGGHSDLQTARRANPSLSHGRYATGEVRNSSCAGSTRITSGHAGALYLRNTPGRLDKA